MYSKTPALVLKSPEMFAFLTKPLIFIHPMRRRAKSFALLYIEMNREQVPGVLLRQVNTPFTLPLYFNTEPNSIHCLAQFRA